MSKKVYHDYPNEWMEKPLNEVCSIVDYRGKTPTKVNEGILLVTARNIKFGSIDYDLSQEYIKECDYDEVMRRGYAKIGDVLYTTEAPLGNVAQVDRDGIALAQRVVKFSGNDSLDNTYLKYFMMSEDFRSHIDKQATGSTVKGIKGSKLKVSPVAIPPLPEQKKIAKILSTVDGHIDEVDGMIEDLKELKKGLMQKLLTEGIGHTEFKDSEVGRIPVEWEVKVIGEFIELKTGGTPSKNNQKYWDDGTVPWMMSGDINKGIINNVSGLITELGLKNSAAKLLPKGCVMIALNGQGKTKGKVALLKIDTTCNQSLAAFMPNDKLIPEYLYYNLQSRYSEIRGLAGDGARNGLNLGLLRGINIPIPCLEEQKQTASVVNSIDERISLFENEKRDLEEMKKGLMQKLLTGKVRVV